MLKRLLGSMRCQLEILGIGPCYSGRRFHILMSMRPMLRGLDEFLRLKLAVFGVDGPREVHLSRQ